MFIVQALVLTLGGASKLSFKPLVTLEEVQKTNPLVAKGRYQPVECSALQHVAILIPHRNREKHLLYLLQHLHPFLQRQQLDYGIYVIHQAGNTKFNRAKLLNVGYLEALKEVNWDCFIFHDVDLVPENDFNIYMCDTQPKHLVVGRNNTGYRLRYQGYFGGVTALTRDQFSKVNGFSNNYWGWGGEDDDLRIRVEMQKMKVVRPPADVARYTMIFHNRDHGNEENRERMKLLRQVSRTWKTDGLNSCSYKLLSVEHNPLYINITVDFSVQPKVDSVTELLALQERMDIVEKMTKIEKYRQVVSEKESMTGDCAEQYGIVSSLGALVNKLRFVYTSWGFE
ncbi:hypothetical protein IHE44_0005772 [Lamprotornis superbus]|uniref:Beta-1,4-galactosyltransferase n=1 Tax=Lamprotornis superbus TaxID=245042 RepID=A0A835TWW1_9PASS|nr:hypothetical protein IHE44_0005772 [Lamprotornis superbus]